MQLNKKYFTLFILLIILIFAIKIPAQVTFQTTFGDSLYNEFGNCIQSTIDGGYIICGSKDYYIDYIEEKSILIKTDSFGRLEWIKTYGSEQSYTRAEYAVQLVDSSYFLIGNHAGGGIFTIRTDAAGDTICVNMPVQSCYPYYSYQLERTKDNNFVFVGSEMWLTGNLKKSYQDTSHLVLVKLDTSGMKLMEKVYSFKGGLGISSMAVTSDGNYVIVTSNDYEPNLDDNRLILMKTDSDGDLLWVKYYDEDVIWWKINILEASNKDLIILANCRQDGNYGKQILLMKTDSTGQIVWYKQYGQENLSFVAFTITPTRDGGYIIGGNPHLIKIDEEGNIEWQKNFSNLSTTQSVIQTVDGGFGLVGWSEHISHEQYFEFDIVFIKTDAQGNITHVSSPSNSRFTKNYTLYQNYPNPFNSLTTIKYNLPKPAFVNLKIYNLAGQEIKTLVNGFRKTGQYNIKWKAEGLPSGIYFYRLQVGEFSETKKLILQK